MRVLIVLGAYPELSETYIRTELHALRDAGFSLTIVSLGDATQPYSDHLPYERVSSKEEILKLIKERRVDVIHTHYLIHGPITRELSHRAGIPYTIRTHSFDVLQLPKLGTDDPGGERGVKRRARLTSYRVAANDPACIGILGLPFARERLQAAGIGPEKLVVTFPTVNIRSFLDRSPNGNAIMNTGAALPKKAMDGYFHLATLMPERTFNLFAVGHKRASLDELNARMGSPVKLMDPIEPVKMPKHYKDHAWLVYTASAEMGAVGWPVAVAEAQASGVGVCMQKIRDDLQDYVGKAGHLFDDVTEVPELVAEAPLEEQRELGFELALRSDVRTHLHLLTDVWHEHVGA